MNIKLGEDGRRECRLGKMQSGFSGRVRKTRSDEILVHNQKIFEIKDTARCTGITGNKWLSRSLYVEITRFRNKGYLAIKFFNHHGKECEIILSRWPSAQFCTGQQGMHDSDQIETPQREAPERVKHNGNKKMTNA